MNSPRHVGRNGTRGCPPPRKAPAFVRQSSTPLHSAGPAQTGRCFQVRRRVQAAFAGLLLNRKYLQPSPLRHNERRRRLGWRPNLSMYPRPRTCDTKRDQKVQAARDSTVALPG